MNQTIALSVNAALQEDVGSGDVSASLIASDAQSTARVLCREACILCGRDWFDEVFRQIDASVVLTWHYQDGDLIPPQTFLCELKGNSRSILTAERTALNFMQLLSATATLTRTYVERVQHTHCRILDTRKTLPGLRLAQKYAVRCGSGLNHRIGLYDRVLIKENHIQAAGSIQAAIQTARQQYPDLLVEVETENLSELREATEAAADIIMLDNFSLADMQTAVSQNTQRIPLEASGGVNLETVAAIAETGVDFISVGEITKNIKAIDLSMRFQ